MKNRIHFNLVAIFIVISLFLTGCARTVSDSMSAVEGNMITENLSLTVAEESSEPTEADDEESIREHHHTFPITETVEAGCTTDGYYLEVCTECGVEREVPIPAKGHTPEAEIQVAPTETQEGLLQTFCSVCGESLGMDTIPALSVPVNNGNSNDPVIITPVPQENASSNTSVNSTSDSGASQENASSDNLAADNAANSPAATGVYIVSQETFSVFDGAASWITTWYSDGSCNTELIWTELADELFTTEAHEHHYDELVVEPTCMSTGYTKHWCSCGDSYITDETPMVDHKMKRWTSAQIAEGTIVIDDEGNLINDTPGWEITSEYRCEYGCGWTVLTVADFDWKQWGWLAIVDEDIFHQFDEEGNRIIIGNQWTDIPEDKRALIWVDSYGEACDIPGFVPYGTYRGFFGNTDTPMSCDYLGTPRNYGFIELSSGHWFASHYGNDPDPKTLILHSRQTTSFYAE